MVDGLDDAEEGRRLEQTAEIDHKNSRLYSNFENIGLSSKFVVGCFA
jgi:hypothetical protein